MKVVILAGGLGSRLSEETNLKPKPMVEIGGKPMLWHIMKIYSHYGFNDFVILLGYKGYIVKEYFTNYYLHQSDVTVNLKDNTTELFNNTSEPWKVSLIDTGKDTLTGGRIKKAEKYIGHETFMLTYGDGLSDVNITGLVKFHRSQNKVATMTSVQPEGRFGALNIENNVVKKFLEKPKGDGNWINGGFFVCEPKIFDFIEDNDMEIFERAPLERLSQANELSAFKHFGFWKCMDTLRDKTQLIRMWEDSPQWKVW